MPPIDPNQNRAVKRKPKQRYGAVGRGADTTAQPRPRPKPRPKPAAKARPHRPSPSGDMRDRQIAARQKQLARSITKTPDQADRNRTPAQKRRDARVVDRTVKESRTKVLIRRRQEKGRKIVRTLTAPIRMQQTPTRRVSSQEAARLRAQGKKVLDRRGASGATITARNQGTLTIGGRLVNLADEDDRAAVLKVLEQTMRPIHGVAAGTRAGIKGENVPEAVGRGLALKDRSLFSDVLRDLGVKGPAASIAGFALDVLADPTTYITAGTASVARSAATKASRRVEKRALKLGLTPEQARRFGERAGREAAKRAGNRRGVDVRFAGKSVPGVTRATARVGQAGKKVAGRPGRAASDAARKVGGDFSTGVRPAGIDRATYEQVRQATRTARSTQSREVYKVRQRAQAVQKAIGKQNYTKVLDAIEAGTIQRLPTELQAPARFLRDQFKYVRRVEKQAGIKGATRRNYVPHLATDLTERGKGMGAQSVGARQIRPSSSKARKDQRTLAQIRATDPGKYVEDPGVLYAARMSEGAMSRAKAELNRRLAGLGTPLKRGAPVDPARLAQKGEAVFHIKGSDIRQLDLGKKADRDMLQAFVDGSGRHGGQFVALNSKAVDRALKTVQPGADRSTVGMVFDRAQGAWKFAATQINPGFHLRNLVGDAQNAYLAQSAPRLARNLGHSARALTELGRQEKALRTLPSTARPVNTRGKGVKIDGKRVSYAELIREAERVGGIRSGFVSRELHDLMEGKRTVKPGTRAATLRRWLNNREDVIRLATYIGSRQKGLGPEAAAARTARYHFDYSDLTELERRVMRRIMPFWTFSARNIPLQIRSLISRPGKFAQYEKLRTEISRAFGYEDSWENDLSESEQRGAPIGIRIGGRPYTISLGPSGLPLTDLNEFPTSKNPAKQADEWINRAMSLVTPAVKTPVELWANMSFFFRDQIEKDDAPLVPVSSAVANAIPERFREDLGFTREYVDKRSGKKQWAAPAKIVYALNVLPGPASFLNRVTTPSERPGQDARSKTAGYLGVRVRPVDAITTRVNNLYEERGEVDKEMRKLNQQGINADRPTPEYRELQMRERDITRHIMALRTQRGDKILPGRGPSTPGADAEAEKLLRGVGGAGGVELDQDEVDRLLRGVGLGG